jgi:hypothetical protein
MTKSFFSGHRRSGSDARSGMTTIATIAAAVSFGSSRLLKITFRPDFDSRMDWFRIRLVHEFCAGVGRSLLGACPSSGGIFATNLIPFEA